MAICSLGAEWKDPSKIPLQDIIEEWCAQSKRGRYEGSLWTPEALEAAVLGQAAAAPAAPPRTAAATPNAAQPTAAGPPIPHIDLD